ncbi:AsnC family transcriptional regulator [Streptomyces sp. NPDC051940]|uniref:Lrp/AsnC family transcriptional regulator n=1 Tax=Streptomyces sp. NPDC051940 TaxID=3155675 RepID=UPI00341AEBF7
MEPVAVDVDDRRVLHALQLDGRASFARIAATLGMSERTVSRRYHRLRCRLALRVVGVTRPAAGEQEDWFLRVTAPSTSIEAVARRLAGRDDTSWIALLAGDGALTGILRVPAPTAPIGDRTGALEQLRRSADIATVTAQRLLAPISSAGGSPGRLEALTAGEREALAPGTAVDRAAPPSAGHPLSDQDARLLRLLASDGRTSNARLARASGTSESTVRRRIAELTGSGMLAFEVEVDSTRYGRQVDVLCWLDVQPAALGAVAAALGSHPEVAFAATTTGSTGLLALLELADAGELHRYLVERVAALPGVHRVRTDIVARWIKRAGPLGAVRG